MNLLIVRNAIKILREFFVHCVAKLMFKITIIVSKKFKKSVNNV